jgi:DNA helicase HerA-like ATPase
MTLANLNPNAGIPLRYANRHGLITGATGTGKTVSLMRLAEQFARQGVPVLAVDAKGDVAALARSCDARHLDAFGEEGEPMRFAFDRMGADLVSRALDLSEAQAGSLHIALAYAKDSSLDVASVADLRAVLGMLQNDRQAIAARYGLVSPASLGVVARGLLRLDTEGATRAFGEPAFDVASLLEPGLVSILSAARLMMSPRLYSAAMLAILADLSARLPETGDAATPRLVVFIDEAHMLFSEMPAGLLRRIEQTVRLIRSKGVGLYFVTQAEADIPRAIGEQLAHRVAHDRALAIGSARFRTMSEAGSPLPETVARIDPPSCQLGALAPSERRATPLAALPGKPEGEAMDWHGYAFLGLVAVCLLGLGAALASFPIGKIAAGFLGSFLALWLAYRKRRRAVD